MSEYIIETKHLTKQYGTQKSVADLNIHVEKLLKYTRNVKYERGDNICLNM